MTDVIEVMEGGAPELADGGPAGVLVSPSELVALALAARGLSAVEGGAASGISAATVEVHRRNLVRKLGARNLTHAVAIACHSGLVAWDPGPGRERTEVAELAAAAARAGARDDVDAARVVLRRLLRGEAADPADRDVIARLRRHVSQASSLTAGMRGLEGRARR